MPPAATLSEAAKFCSENLNAKWAADTLRAGTIAFGAACIAQLPVATPNNVPLANWIAVISAFAPSILNYEYPTAFGNNGIAQETIVTYQAAVDYVYRFLKLAAYFQTQNLITNTQVLAILTAYNANFA